MYSYVQSGAKLVKSKNLCCQLVVFTRCSLLRWILLNLNELERLSTGYNSFWKLTDSLQNNSYTMKLSHIFFSKTCIVKVKLFFLFIMAGNSRNTFNEEVSQMSKTLFSLLLWEGLILSNMSLLKMISAKVNWES